MTEEDLLVELPGTVWINNYPFVLLETDKVRMHYIARPCSNVPASEIRVRNLQPRICQFLPVCVRKRLATFLRNCRNNKSLLYRL
jgi:hypothetical protein